jgi:hypothetical protein
MINFLPHINTVYNNTPIDKTTHFISTTNHIKQGADYD